MYRVNSQDCEDRVFYRQRRIDTPDVAVLQNLNELYQRRLELLQQKRPYDFTIICGDKKWDVHRALMEPQSKYFENMFAPGSQFKESQTNILELNNMDPTTLEFMLSFVYNYDYLPPMLPVTKFENEKYIVVKWHSESPDHIRRGDRRALEEGLHAINLEGMRAAVSLVYIKCQGLSTNTPVRRSPNVNSHQCTGLSNGAEMWDKNCLVLLPFHDLGQASIKTPLLEELLELVKEPQYLEGEPFMDPDSTANLLLHAHMYQTADYFKVKGLKTIALEKFISEIPELAFWGKHVYDAIYFLMRSTPADDVLIRKFLAKIIRKDMELFGVRDRVKEVFKEFPELETLCISDVFSDDSDRYPLKEDIYAPTALECWVL